MKLLSKSWFNRWKNWVIRVIFTVIMIVGFSLIIYSGPLALIIMVDVVLVLSKGRLISNSIFQSLAAQTKCFQEVISIGNAVYRVHGLPWLRSLSWYFFFTFNYFLYGAYIIDYYGIDANTSTVIIQFLVIVWLTNNFYCLFLEPIAVPGVVSSLFIILLVWYWNCVVWSSID